MSPRFDIRSDQRAPAPGNGSVPFGASNSRQPYHVAIKIDGGDYTNRKEDDAVSQSNARASASRQRDDAPNADKGRKEPEREDIGERDAWVASIEKKLQDYTRSEEAETETVSIPRVPKGPRGFNQLVDKAYEPRVISIGLYHRDKPHLQNMQKHKWHCLKDIRDHGGRSFDLNEYFKKLKEQEKRARSFYPESKLKLNSMEFLEMLLLDGCFIVDYLRRASSDESKNKKSKTKIWSDHQIRNDLLLLENQLPFFVVECIYCLVEPPNDTKKLVEIAVKLFLIISPKDLEVHEPEKRDFKHLLHLYHAFLFFDDHDGWKEAPQEQGEEQGQGASQEQGEYREGLLVSPLTSRSLVGGLISSLLASGPQGKKKKKKEQEKGASQVRTIPRAILLQEAGIKLKKSKMLDKAVNVRFSNGVMNITPLIVDAFAISQYRNLIEFERAHPDMEPRFTAFLQFMDCIINTAEDVALLRKNDILDHAFGSDEEVAGIFNRLTSGTFHQLSWELKKVYENTNKHCKDNWNRWWATLLQDHFGSPWAAIAILVTVLLISFEFIQTFFSVYSYFRPRSAS